MNREFLEFYNRELALLREQASEFAQEYPGVAERLGGLMDDRLDPMIGGLLEGSAFLAARVQLKIKHEFAEFTTNLLDQLVPHYLAPTPSALLAQVQPKFGDPALRDGRTIARGSYLDAAYRELERNIACRFRSGRADHAVALRDRQCGIFSAARPAAGAGSAGRRGMFGGPALATDGAQQQNATKTSLPIRKRRSVPNCAFPPAASKILPSISSGTKPDAVMLYEQMFAHCTRRLFSLSRFLRRSRRRSRAARICCIRSASREDEALVRQRQARVSRLRFSARIFHLPAPVSRLFAAGPWPPSRSKLAAKTVDVVFVFDESNTRLAAAVRREFFALYAAPAVNLFEKTVDRIPVKANQHEYQIVPDRSRHARFRAEPHPERLRAYSRLDAESRGRAALLRRRRPKALRVFAIPFAVCRDGAPPKKGNMATGPIIPGPTCFFRSASAPTLKK